MGHSSSNEASDTEAAMPLDPLVYDRTKNICERIDALSSRLGRATSVLRELQQGASCDIPASQRTHGRLRELMPAFYNRFPFRLTALAYDSDSPQPASASQPRLILFDGFQTVMGVQADFKGPLHPYQINNNTLEVLEYHCEQAEWVPYLVREESDENNEPCLRMYESGQSYGTKGAPLETHCQSCHGASIRPIWDDYPFWPKFLGTDSQSIRGSDADKALHAFVVDKVKTAGGIYAIFNKDKSILNRHERDYALTFAEYGGFINVGLGYLQSHRIARRLEAFAKSRAQEDAILNLWINAADPYSAATTASENLVGIDTWAKFSTSSERTYAAQFTEVFCASGLFTGCDDLETMFATFERFASSTPGSKKDSDNTTVRSKMYASRASKIERAKAAFAWGFADTNLVAPEFAIRLVHAQEWFEQAKMAFLLEKLSLPREETDAWFHVKLPIEAPRVPWEIQSGAAPSILGPIAENLKQIQESKAQARQGKGCSERTP